MNNLNDFDSILHKTSSINLQTNENQTDSKIINKHTKFKCNSNDCNKPGNYNCPTCKELNILNSKSYYCSKECFKLCW
jgi:hypothetical protein